MGRTDNPQTYQLEMLSYAQPDKDLKLLLTRMELELPLQPPPRIRSGNLKLEEWDPVVVGQTFDPASATCLSSYLENAPVMKIGLIEPLYGEHVTAWREPRPPSWGMM